MPTSLQCGLDAFYIAQAMSPDNLQDKDHLRGGGTGEGGFVPGDVRLEKGVTCCRGNTWLLHLGRERRGDSEGEREKKRGAETEKKDSGGMGRERERERMCESESGRDLA